MIAIRDGTVATDSEIIDGETLLVGSSNDCHVVIRDSSVSPHHMTISRINKLQYQIEDIGSDGGTYVKGQKVIEILIFHHFNFITRNEQGLRIEVLHYSP